MTTLYTHQSKNKYKTWALMFIFLLVIIGLGWFFSWYYGNPTILVIAVVFSVGMNIFSYWYSDTIALKTAGAKEAPESEYPRLHDIVENLAITAGLPKPDVYVIEDVSPNAFATGRNPDNAVVAVTTGLMSRLEKSELEGVIAHELAHIGNRDILLQTIVVVLVGFIALISDMFIRAQIFGFGGNRNRGGWIALVGIALAILSPLIATLIRFAISRKREFMADASGALLTRYPDGLANALEKISNYDKEVDRATNATAHLYFSNPFGGGEEGTSFWHKLFMTHPPTEERIQRLRERKI
jgi:heat shock protein HtpX